MNKILLLLFVFLSTLGPSVFAQPPEYAGLNRVQILEHDIPNDKLVRIWMLNVGQGDSLLIQIPRALAEEGDQYFDVLVDTGKTSNALHYLKEIYAENLIDVDKESAVVIENVVITHHDSDHVKAFTAIADDPSFQINRVHHNGLASYTPKAVKKSDNTNPRSVIASWNDDKDKMERFMADLIRKPGKKSQLDASFLINNLSDLEKGHKGNLFHGVYKNFANAVLNAKPKPVKSFDLSGDNKNFIKTKANQVRFTPIWPTTTMYEYYNSGFGGNNWSETINGQSVTFRLDYGDFSMLFTGDHNHKSEADLLKHLEKKGTSELLTTDILKVPHHGSRHGIKPFFSNDKEGKGKPNTRYAFGIASMGGQGFKSWRHPSDEVRNWMGYIYQFYSTYTHEKGFSHKDDTFSQNRHRFIEQSHILIETDGDFFRIIEIPLTGEINLEDIPKVLQVKKGNGTRWVSTKVKGE